MGDEPDEATQQRWREEADAVESRKYEILDRKVRPPIPWRTGHDSDELTRYVDPESRNAYDTLMSAQLVLVWTAIETLAGDLWLYAVNTQPQYLAGLTGDEGRIETLAGSGFVPDTQPSTEADGEVQEGEGESEQEDDEREPAQGKGVSLSEMCKMTRGDYNLSNKMGDLLLASERVKFTSVRGIRKAYSLAFPRNVRRAKSARIDRALADKSLDALSLVRNLIVHRAGTADPVSERDCKSAPLAPKLKDKEPLLLDGILCKTLIESAIKPAIELIQAVDSWLTLTRR